MWYIIKWFYKFITSSFSQCVLACKFLEFFQLDHNIKLVTVVILAFPMNISQYIIVIWKQVSLNYRKILTSLVLINNNIWLQRRHSLFEIINVIIIIIFIRLIIMVIFSFTHESLTNTSTQETCIKDFLEIPWHSFQKNS